MKKLSTCLLAVLCGTGLMAQLKPVKPNTLVPVGPVRNIEFSGTTTTPVVAPRPVNSNKTTAVSPVMMGTASNLYTVISDAPTPVDANNDLNTIVFNHRNDASVYGGSSALVRYDISIDGGATFGNDVGYLNPTSTLIARYPNVELYNPTGNTNPFNAIVFSGMAGLNSSSKWERSIASTASVNTTTAGTPTVYSELELGDKNDLSIGHTTQRVPGEFWFVWDKSDDDASLDVDTVVAYKYVMNTTTYVLTPTRYDFYTPSEKTIPDGNGDTGERGTSPQIEFSPDGMIGYIAYLGDLVGGMDSVYSPIYKRTTDGGATWGSWQELDLSTISAVKDSLEVLWGQDGGSLGIIPVSSGKPTTGFQMDMSVDNNGALHIFTTLGSGSTQDSTGNDGEAAYSIYSGLAKYAIDIEVSASASGSTPTDVHFISSVLTFRKTLGTDPNTVGMDNCPQIGRNVTGDKMFYCWIDSDTTGNFGASDNDTPDLIIGSMDVPTGNICVKNITRGDGTWGGKILFPKLSDIVLNTFVSGVYELPIVFSDLPTGDPISPAQFYYIGNDATLDVNSCNVVVNMTDNVVNTNAVLAYPNPANNSATVAFELTATSNASLNVTNVMGQNVMTLNETMNAGYNNFEVNTSSLADGIYFFTLNVNGASVTKKITVAH